MEFGLSFGSNLGNRVDNLREARARVLNTADARLVAASSLYETKPVGVRPEHADKFYINAVLVIESDASAKDWLGWLNRIENDLGRIREEDRNAPRPIDIDILYAGDQYIDSAGLTVPHPRWAERRFVVEPLAEIRGELVLPGNTRSVSEILADLVDDAIKNIEAPW